jgi:hypothetical protein
VRGTERPVAPPGAEGEPESFAAVRRLTADPEAPEWETAGTPALAQAMLSSTLRRSHGTTLHESQGRGNVATD